MSCAARAASRSALDETMPGSTTTLTGPSTISVTVLPTRSPRVSSRAYPSCRMCTRAVPVIGIWALSCAPGAGLACWSGMNPYFRLMIKRIVRIERPNLHDHKALDPGAALAGGRGLVLLLQRLLVGPDGSA